jgi:hypothetical protein
MENPTNFISHTFLSVHLAVLGTFKQKGYYTCICEFIHLNNMQHHVRWVPYHHGMARPQVADGDALQVWRVVSCVYTA